MSSKRRWTGYLITLTAALLLIPMTPWLAPDNDDGRARKPVPSAPQAAAASREQKLKMASVTHDMNDTAALCKMECSLEFRKLSNEQGSSKQTLRHMKHMHPHMTYIEVHKKNGALETAGSLPGGLKSAFQQHLEKAKRSFQAGHAQYSSDSFKHDGHRYIVLAVAADKGTGMTAGLIRQDIVDQVAKHQRRNLRLVPYPAEGRYRTESVEPNTTRDITVETGEDNGDASHYHKHEVVVRFRTMPTDDQMKQIMASIGGTSVRKLGYSHVFASNTMQAEDMMRYFTEEWNPVYVEPHYLYLTNGEGGTESNANQPIVPNDALYSQYQWNLPSIRTELGWKMTKGSEEVIVAVLDTGVQLDHPDLSGRMAEGYNVVGDGPPDDDVGHGTHVAGVISAAVNNGEGVAGMSWYNKVMPIKVLDSSGTGTTYSVAEGLIWAVDHGAKVVNMSLGNYASAEFLHDAIRYAYDHDVVLIAASGNDDTDRPGFPAAYPEVFAVAATSENGEKASFSNYGDYIDVAAPGDNIPSTYPGNQYAALSGTSMASPHVAALAGLIRTMNPSLSNEEVMAIMRETATDLGEAGKDIYYGYGQIDVARALQAAEQSANSLGGYAEQVKRRIDAIKLKFGL
jgi:thermitase